MRRFDYYAGVLILASALFFGQMAARHGEANSAAAPSVVSAREIRLYDKAGKLRAHLCADDVNASLILYGPNGKTKAEVSQGDLGFMLTGGAAQKHGSVLLTASDDGGTSLLLTGKPKSFIDLDTDLTGWPSAQFYQPGYPLHTYPPAP